MGQSRATSHGGTLAEHDGGGKSGGAGTHVHHGAAGEVKGAHLHEPASAPHPVGHGAVHHKQPERGKEKHGLEVYALGIRAGDERGSQRGEHALEGHERKRRDGTAFQRLLAHAEKHDVLKAADKSVNVRTERQRVAHKGPEQRAHAEKNKTVHGGGKHVAGSHEPAVEQSERRHHEHDQHGADKNKTRIGSVHRYFLLHPERQILHSCLHIPCQFRKNNPTW